MKYLKTYKNHNEGVKSTLATAGLVGSLLTTPVDSISQSISNVTTDSHWTRNWRKSKIILNSN